MAYIQRVTIMINRPFESLQHMLLLHRNIGDSVGTSDYQSK